MNLNRHLIVGMRCRCTYHLFLLSLDTCLDLCVDLRGVGCEKNSSARVSWRRHWHMYVSFPSSSFPSLRRTGCCTHSRVLALWCLTSQAFAYSLTHYDRQLKPLGYPGNMFFVFDVKLARTSLTHSYPVRYCTPFVYTLHLISVPAVSVLSVAYSSVHPRAFVEWSPYVHHCRTR